MTTTEIAIALADAALAYSEAEDAYHRIAGQSTTSVPEGRSTRLRAKEAGENFHAMVEAYRVAKGESKP